MFQPRGQPLPPQAPSQQRPEAAEVPAAEDELRQAVDKVCRRVMCHATFVSQTLVEQIRGYNELLDEFSLHQFIIRRGRVLDSTPEFRSFKRTHAAQWGPITIVISALERLLTEYAVPTAYVDGQAVAQLASDELASANPTTEALLQCIANIDQVAPLLKLPGQRFVGAHGRVAAAVAIQATFRMYLCRMMYLGRKVSPDRPASPHRQWFTCGALLVVHRVCPWPHIPSSTHGAVSPTPSKRVPSCARRNCRQRISGCR